MQKDNKKQKPPVKSKEKIEKLSSALRQNLLRRKATKKQIEFMTKNFENELYIGFMSGTSLDGVDASLVRTNGDDKFEAIDNFHAPYPDSFRKEMQKFLGHKKLAHDLEKQLTEFHIEAAAALLKKQNLKSSDIRGIGFHGQTIYHKPEDGITVQSGDAKLLAKATDIDVIYDFRTRDVECGGQGAPLVPIFHKLLVKDQNFPVAVINIGGVANITYINQNDLIAFDTGPGIALIDDAMNQFFQKPFDDQGKVAASGSVDYTAVKELLAHEYFSAPYPKSLDRNQFKFLSEKLAHHEQKDIVATLTYITAATIGKALISLPQLPKKIFLCGGGSKNNQIILFLDAILQEKKHQITIENISKINDFDPDYIESQAFAYLAARFLHKLPSSFSSTTGVQKPVICGQLMQKID
jgi:anhydro-N-acetylmuramic acid kinase